MAYDLQLAQINTNFGGLSITHPPSGNVGFPSNTDFDTLLMSYWMCGPYSPVYGSPAIYPAFASAHFFDFFADNSSATGDYGTVGIYLKGWIGAGLSATMVTIFTANLPPVIPTTPPGCLLHFLMSVNTSTQTVQVYINDQPVTLISPTWHGTAPFHFNTGPYDYVSIWAWDVRGVAAGGNHPAFGDAWITNPPSFVDLSVVANRRKFIAADLTPVDLGDTGTIPFGYQPHIYMSIRPGGAPADIQINRGDGGYTWHADTGAGPPSWQTAFCSAIPVPPTLGMDNLLALDDLRALGAEATFVEGEKVFLEWSDTRGRVWSNPVGVPLGPRGKYLRSLQWQRLGYARDRVFRLTWSAPTKTALQGCFLETDTRAKS